MRPLLACKVPKNLNDLPFPIYASVKLDGIRCIIKDGVAYSRTLKPIPNAYVQSILGRPEYDGLDGELIVGLPNMQNCMRVTTSGVMSVNGKPNFTYYVFDIWDRPTAIYQEALELVNTAKHYRIIPVPQLLCWDAAQVETCELDSLNNGYEGLILRRPDAPYKFGRATIREGYLFKLKRFIQEEAIIIGYEPLQHNENEVEINALGYTQRSSAQGNKVDLFALGALIVRGTFNGDANVVFKIGTGFTMTEREALWQIRDQLKGKIVSYKFFPTGSKDRPRHPVFVSFRDPEDM